MKSSDGEEETLQSRERDDDVKKRLVQIFFLPLDLVLRIIAHLPSRVLFDFRCLCKAARPRALLALARRPFFVLQKESPSSLCFLLPLDSPCSPLPCSFNLAKPSFRLLFASGSLLCLQRHYNLLLDICVCNIFRKWKIIVPPIVHPSLAPQLSRRVFFEDSNVEFLRVVGFHAVQPTIDTHEEAHAQQLFSPGYRIFVACETYLNVFDSCLNQWSGRVYFPGHLSAQLSQRHRVKLPVCFTTSDGNLILTFSSKARALFKYKDQSFQAMELAFHPGFEVAGYPASADVDASFSLKIRFPHVEECVRSSPQGGLVLQGLCKSDADTPYGRYFSYHRHNYSRQLLHSFCHAYQGKVYALVMERDEMHCDVQNPEYFYRYLKDGHFSSNKCHNMQWHDLPSEDVEKYFHPGEDADFDCDQLFPARSSRKLTLYSACVDTTNWTMNVSKEADATTSLDVFNKKDMLVFMSG